MSLLQKINAILHHEPPVPPRDWAEPAKADGRQPPPIERTAMATPSDVALQLSARAAQRGLTDDWRYSLDALLKLLDHDPAPDAQRRLAADLNIDAGEPGTARHDAALYEALMQRLSENGAVATESFYK